MSQADEVKYEIRCIRCNESLTVEKVWMDGANNIADKDVKTKRVMFHVQPCGCRAKETK